MPIVISVENLSKVYRLGQIGTGTLTNDLRVWWATKVRRQPNPLLKIGQADHGNQAGEDLYALRDVSFTVEQGEVPGNSFDSAHAVPAKRRRARRTSIGRNSAGTLAPVRSAGESTLLKILSRVTAPTSGQAKVKGCIASLLDAARGTDTRRATGLFKMFANIAISGSI